MSNAVIVKSFDCGCGWRSEDEAQAFNHANLMEHIVTIHGRIVVAKEFHQATEYTGRGRGRARNGRDDAA